MTTLLSYFVDAVDRHPHESLFRSSEGSVTYGDAALMVVQAINQFTDLRIQPGDRVIGYTDETIPLGLLLLSAGLARLIPASISPIFSATYVRSLCEQSRARAVFTTPALWALARSMVNTVPVLSYLHRGNARPQQVEEPADFAEPPSWPFARTLNVRGGLEMLHKLARVARPEDALLIQPTSGSTGAPKLVLRRNCAFTRYADLVGAEVEHAVGGVKRFRMFLPNALTHAFACHMFTLGMRFGAEFVLPAQLDNNASLKELRVLDPDVLTMTPRILRSFVRQQLALGDPPGTPLFGPSTKLVLSAGGRSDVATYQRLREQGVEVIEFYGSSEASVVAVTPYGKWRPGRAGLPAADGSIKFSRNNEIFVRNPGIMLGYYGDSELTELVIDEEGYYRTGDLGRLDPDGYLEIFGRRRDVFNTPEGTNIYPERIEILLESQPWIRQAFLVGDGKPFVTVHIVVDPAIVKDAAAAAAGTENEHGFLPPEDFAEFYDQMGHRLARLNEGLELLEQIVAFALYVRPFPEDCYEAETAKIRRTRASFMEQFAALVDRVYAEPDPESVMLVPPRERRYARRVDNRLRPTAVNRPPSQRPVGGTPISPAPPPIPRINEEEDRPDSGSGESTHLTVERPGISIEHLLSEIEEQAQHSTERVLVAAQGHSVKGRHDVNEDAFVVDSASGLYAVADGLGASTGAQVPSSVALDALIAHMVAGVGREASSGRRLVDAFDLANRAVRKNGGSDHAERPAATTLTAALFLANRRDLLIAHVGNSRCYRQRGGALTLLTEDHVRPTRVGRHPSLLRAVGATETVRPDLLLETPMSGDRYLLCTDGLIKKISEAEIAGLMTAHGSAAVRPLLELATTRGAKDDSTAVIIEIVNIVPRQPQ